MNHRNLGWNKRLRSGLIGALGLLGMLCLGHCYRPTYEGPYSCDPAHASVDCPDGWSCQNGLCTAPGSATVATGACSGAGTLLAMSRGGQVWACEGSFASTRYLMRTRAVLAASSWSKSSSSGGAMLENDSIPDQKPGSRYVAMTSSTGAVHRCSKPNFTAPADRKSVV